MVVYFILKILAILVMFQESDEAFLISKEESEAGENGIGQNWALLVAGSSTWPNYRHQADVCHAYQIFHRNGFPDSNIVVMMYDDIAYNSANPLQGVILNDINGTNVYEGVVKDYTGEDVTPENFFNILQGNEKAMMGIGSGKVIKSGPNDRIFVNLVDHGATGIFAFPSSYLHAEDLIAAITAMYRYNKFKEMIFYVEACESGSMFDGLLADDINVFAVTASTPDESSYACCYDSDLHVYLGDLFSVAWMEDTDSENTNKETFEGQFNIVVNDTEGTETPCKYGDEDIEYEKLSNFLGSSQHINKEYRTKDNRGNKSQLRKQSAVKSPNVPFYILENKLFSANSEDEKDVIRKEIIQLHKNRIFLSNKVEEIVMRITMKYDLVKEFMKDEPTHVYQWSCYRSAVKDFHDKCFNLGKNSFALRLVGIFSKLCNHGYSPNEIQDAILQVCDHPPVHDII